MRKLTKWESIDRLNAGETLYREDESITLENVGNVYLDDLRLNGKYLSNEEAMRMLLAGITLHTVRTAVWSHSNYYRSYYGDRYRSYEGDFELWSVV